MWGEAATSMQHVVAQPSLPMPPVTPVGNGKTEARRDKFGSQNVRGGSKSKRMTIRLLCFPVLLGHKEKEDLAQTWQHWCETPLASVIFPYTHAKSKPYIFLQFKEREEERQHHTHLFRSETPGNMTLIFCNERVTPDDICFSAMWVAFTFMCTIHSKGHTQGGTELEVKPWSKMHSSRSGTISRPFTERCEKGSRLCIKRLGVSSREKTAHNEGRSKFVVAGWA